jgi:hypothetical protein
MNRMKPDYCCVEIERDNIKYNYYIKSCMRDDATAIAEHAATDDFYLDKRLCSLKRWPREYKVFMDGGPITIKVKLISIFMDKDGITRGKFMCTVG